MSLNPKLFRGKDIKYYSRRSISYPLLSPSIYNSFVLLFYILSAPLYFPLTFFLSFFPSFFLSFFLSYNFSLPRSYLSARSSGMLKVCKLLSSLDNNKIQLYRQTDSMAHTVQYTTDHPYTVDHPDSGHSLHSRPSR